MIAALALSAASCGSNSQNTGAASTQEVAPNVEVAKAVVRDVPQEVSYASTVQAWAVNNIMPQQGGRIRKIKAEVGDYVTAGSNITSGPLDPKDILRLNGVDGVYQYLLKDIAMNIPNGSLVLLLGGSGAGKTTFMNAIIGYEKADADIYLNGTNIYKQYSQMKYRIGFVTQMNLVRTHDTVFRTISDAAKLRMPLQIRAEERNKRVGEVMDFLGLTPVASGLVSKMSGGQLRRISIAIELVSDPDLFVLDEPDSGLDGVIARELFEKLKEISETGKIVIVITHTPDRVIDLFDKVIILAKDSGRVGRLAFYGSPDEAKEFFGRKTMEDIVQCVNRSEEGGEGLADEYIEKYARSRIDSSTGKNTPQGSETAEKPAEHSPEEAEEKSSDDQAEEDVSADDQMREEVSSDEE